MGLLDRIFLGQVLGEWQLDRAGFVVGVETVSLVLARRRGKLRLAIKRKQSSLFGFNVHYSKLPVACLPRLREATLEACVEMESNQEVGS